MHAVINAYVVYTDDVYLAMYDNSGPPTSNETECMDPCKLTYCDACYYYNTTLPPPRKCDGCCEDPYCLACVREWAVCTDRINTELNKVYSVIIFYVLS